MSFGSETDFKKYILDAPPNALHPTNIMLKAAFSKVATDHSNDVQEWAVESAEVLDKIYSAGLRRYIGKGKIYQEDKKYDLVGYYDKIISTTRNKPLPKKRLELRWLVQRMDWEKFKETLGRKPKRQATSKELSKKIENVEAAASGIKIVCYKPKDPGEVDNRTGPISFCSKYAFFLNHITPIYDSMACDAFKKISANAARPNNYSKFVKRFIALLDEIYPDQQYYTSDEIKNLDGYLWDIGRGNWTSKGWKEL